MKHLFYKFCLNNKVPKLLIALISITLLFASCDTNNKSSDYSKVTSPIDFTPNIPVDVDPAVQQKLKDEGNIYQLNEAFNMYSWQAFIAIQWPRDKDGNALPNFNDEGEPTWLGWKEAFQVYRSDGYKPAPWGSPRNDSGLGLPTDALGDSDSRIILSSVTPTHPNNFNITDEVDQAFAGKLFDQNGNVVVYEVLMNREEYDYIIDSTLYNINGQINFSKNNTEANFPIGNYDTGELGAVEIKFAWKILEDTDYKDRYFTDEGYLINEATGELDTIPTLLGMIGMHISQKTPTGKQWVWSTFEHIDNLRQNSFEKDGKTIVVSPSLRDPDCEICPANVDVTNGTTYTFNDSDHGSYWTISGDTINKYYASSDVMKTQAKRMIDIPVRVQNINKQMQAYFKQQNSVWQYYELIDTQYPLDQNAIPTISTSTEYIIPGTVTNKPGGDPNLALLTNLTMETFFQTGNQIAGLMETSPFPPSGITIFGTESCMGCHSSARIYNSYSFSNGKISFGKGGQLSGDFSWLMGKAKWNDSIPKPTQ